KFKVMTFRVALVGHSNVPDGFHHPGAVVTICKKRGAHIRDFYKEPELMKVFNDKYDLVFIYLGSNDVVKGGDTVEIPKLTREIAIDIKNRTGAKVIAIALEPRNCPENYHTPTEDYRRLARAINSKIRLKKKDDYGVLHLWQFLRYHISEDGYHFDREGRAYLRDRIGKQITKHMALKRN
ncbi:MAG: SGNH/GDSL hydrolase family protein, partial [Cyanobacteria bacterium J06553_1]